MKALRIGVLLLLVASSVESAMAIMIAPNRDTYVDESAQTTVRDYPTDATGGITMKGQSGARRIGLVEFTIPNVTATSATFNFLHIRSWAAATSWTFQLLGRQIGFDETTITWANGSAVYTSTGATTIGSALTMAGGNSGQDLVPPQLKSVDMTTFFNANKGAVVTLIMRCTSTGSSQGGTAEDQEGARTGNPANGPYISYVPEPVSMLLLLAGLPMIRRRSR